MQCCRNWRQRCYRPCNCSRCVTLLETEYIYKMRCTGFTSGHSATGCKYSAVDRRRVLGMNSVLLGSWTLVRCNSGSFVGLGSLDGVRRNVLSNQTFVTKMRIYKLQQRSTLYSCVKRTLIMLIVYSQVCEWDTFLSYLTYCNNPAALLCFYEFDWARVQTACNEPCSLYLEVLVAGIQKLHFSILLALRYRLVCRWSRDS